MKKIAIAGPYSAATEKEQEENLKRMNFFAVKVAELGHIPVIGMNAALGVVNEKPELTKEERYNWIMKISLGVVGDCDAIFILKESPGVLKEKELLISKNKPVFADFNLLTKYLKEA
ncbi:MAG: hypothetical protein IAF38_01655 [Bacteroidia bacterium]|nr:hypothetical protein [Bacteroidia bacterium]